MALTEDDVPFVLTPYPGQERERLKKSVQELYPVLSGQAFQAVPLSHATQKTQHCGCTGFILSSRDVA